MEWCLHISIFRNMFALAETKVEVEESRNKNKSRDFEAATFPETLCENGLPRVFLLHGEIRSPIPQHLSGREYPLPENAEVKFPAETPAHSYLRLDSPWASSPTSNPNTVENRLLAICRVENGEDAAYNIIQHHVLGSVYNNHGVSPFSKRSSALQAAITSCIVLASIDHSPGLCHHFL